MNESRIRRATSEDFQELAEVMFDAIHNTEMAYDQVQRNAWAPEIPKPEDWVKRLGDQRIFLAESGGQIVGFMTLKDSTYIDFSYIRPAFQGTGLFRRLYAEVESEATTVGSEFLTVHASLKAQPAYSNIGFQIVKRETVEIRGHNLDRFEMKKVLAG